MIISPTRTVVLAIVFHGSGHSKNVYDDDDDVGWAAGRASGL